MLDSGVRSIWDTRHQINNEVAFIHVSGIVYFRTKNSYRCDNRPVVFSLPIIAVLYSFSTGEKIIFAYFNLYSVVFNLVFKTVKAVLVAASCGVHEAPSAVTHQRCVKSGRWYAKGRGPLAPSSGLWPTRFDGNLFASPQWYVWRATIVLLGRSEPRRPSYIVHVFAFIYCALLTHYFTSLL